MGRLTTHVLDTAHGVPAQGVALDLYRIENGTTRALLAQASTDADGRCPAPLLEGPALVRGIYELVFHAGDYFAGQGVVQREPRFVEEVILRFGIANPDENHHVPLLVTPWSWSTYRGS